MILNCVIIDDEPLALDLLESYVLKTPFLNLIGRYSSAVVAMNTIREQKVDVLFLDIQMPDLDGIEFSKMVSPETRIIFITAFS
ncbi:MAG: response regulator, partial [Bacteroidaceae bacterium]|nr:response regulator [Bacteroidaceae bacterium]